MSEKNQDYEKYPDYYDALDRLIKAGAKITNDAVAIEAGRKKGSIKKSRSQMALLIEAINAAAEVQSKSLKKRNWVSQSVSTLEKQLEEALGRELLLLQELWETRRSLDRVNKQLAEIQKIRGSVHLFPSSGRPKEEELQPN